jgi:hypothetical protein
MRSAWGGEAGIEYRRTGSLEIAQQCETAMDHSSVDPSGSRIDGRMETHILMTPRSAHAGDNRDELS